MNPHPQDQDEEEEQDQLDSSDDEIGEFKDTQKPKRSKTTHSKANGNVTSSRGGKSGSSMSRSKTGGPMKTLKMSPISSSSKARSDARRPNHDNSKPPDSALGFIPRNLFNTGTNQPRKSTRTSKFQKNGSRVSPDENSQVKQAQAEAETLVMMEPLIDEELETPSKPPSKGYNKRAPSMANHKSSASSGPKNKGRFSHGSSSSSSNKTTHPINNEVPQVAGNKRKQPPSKVDSRNKNSAADGLEVHPKSEKRVRMDPPSNANQSTTSRKDQGSSSTGNTSLTTPIRSSTKASNTYIDKLGNGKAQGQLLTFASNSSSKPQRQHQAQAPTSNEPKTPSNNIQVCTSRQTPDETPSSNFQSKFLESTKTLLEDHEKTHRKEIETMMETMNKKMESKMKTISYLRKQNQQLNGKLQKEEEKNSVLEKKVKELKGSKGAGSSDGRR